MAGIQPTVRLPELRSKDAKLGNTTGQRRPNPRRTPLRNTTLLPEHKKQKLSHSPEDATLANPPLTQLKSQGSSSNESASHWFDNVNKHITQGTREGSGYDDEPPFFMSNQISYQPNTFAASETSRPFGLPSRLDSENEELRGVIDDLTVENKRLKTILRTNQRSQRGSPSTESQDRLFEVRMHGLSSEKRRELEFLLKNFATSVHTSAPSVSNSTAGSSPNRLTTNRNGKAITDSGYASNSNSGHPPGANSHNTRGIVPVPQSTRDKTINKYLHDIPDTLMPRQQPIIMSERARMALVVRRLEQLFTGRKAAPGEHSQPLQQQEVSQLAASADAKNNKKRKAEGSREAHILPPDSKFNFDAIDVGSDKRKRSTLKQSDSDMSQTEDTGGTISGLGSPDQRPTRPLDLDIHRAQVASDNIQYIRHLGLSSPHLDADNSEHGWMYLNLLINMAQVHTINVTPDFVRRSIQKLSTKFELSKDGHKVRWVGGPEGTVFSKEEEKALEVVDSNKDGATSDDINEDTGNSGSSKRSKTDSASNAVVSNTTSEDKTSRLQTSSGSKQQISTGATSNQLSPDQTQTLRVVSKFDYKPIVYRERASHDLPEESYLQDSDSSMESTSRDSSGLAHALSRSNLNQQRKADEGAITFYNNPYFCSDYSGEKMPSNMLNSRDALSGLILGIHPGDDCEGMASRLADACYFTPQFGPRPHCPSPDEKLPELALVPLSISPREETQPIELPASGLGGVAPGDNFAIDVDVNMVQASSRPHTGMVGQVPFTGTEIKPVYCYQPGRSHKVDLLPSRLPPPSYIFFTSSSSSGNQMDDDDDDDDDMFDDSNETSSSADDEHPAPPSFLRRWSAENSGDVDDAEGDLDDSSVDMLAVARAADPIRIAEQERQYLINEPGGRAVAGSLAATVGASRSSSSASSADADVDSERPEVSEGESDSDMDVDDESL